MLDDVVRARRPRRLARPATAADEVNDDAPDVQSCEVGAASIAVPMHSKTPPRNRLAKVLPEEWREVPRRARRAEAEVHRRAAGRRSSGGRVIEKLIVEEGWIVALDQPGLAGTFEQRIDFDPRQITDVEIVQVV